MIQAELSGPFVNAHPSLFTHFRNSVRSPKLSNLFFSFPPFAISALAHARTHSCGASTETDVCSAFRVFALRSRVPTRVPLVYHPSHLSPFPLSPSTRRELATREHDHVFFPLRVSKRPKENPFDDSSATTDVKNLCNFSPHRRPSG